MSRRRCSAAVLLVLALVLAGCGSYDPGAGGGADPDATVPLGDDLIVRVPSSWHRAAERLTPELDDPREVLAVATYPLRAGGDGCARVPVRALEDLGPRDALLVLFERRAAWDLSEYPRRRGPLERRLERGPAPFCVPDGGREDVWLAFSDHGRAFHALLALGPDASAELREQLFAVLDSLEFVQP